MVEILTGGLKLVEPTSSSSGTNESGAIVGGGAGGAGAFIFVIMAFYYYRYIYLRAEQKIVPLL